MHVLDTGRWIAGAAEVGEERKEAKDCTNGMPIGGAGAKDQSGLGSDQAF